MTTNSEHQPTRVNSMDIESLLEDLKFDADALSDHGVDEDSLTIRSIGVIRYLQDRLRAAEADYKNLMALLTVENVEEYTLECLRLAQHARDMYKKENDILRAQVEAAEKQAPKYWILENSTGTKLVHKNKPTDEAHKYWSVEEVYAKPPMPDKQCGDFTSYPDLANHIERMAATGNTGSPYVWDEFIQCLNRSLQSAPMPAAEPKQEGSPDLVQMANKIVDMIFNLPGDSRGPVTRLQFMGGQYPDKEFNKGGINRAALALHVALSLQDLLSAPPAADGKE